MNVQKYHRGTIGFAAIAIFIAVIWMYFYFTELTQLEVITWDVAGFAVTWNTISSYIFVVLSLLAFIAVLLLANNSAESDLRNTYWGLVIAWFFFMLGETTWFVYANIINVDPPYPSVGDLFWAIGTILLIEELVSLTPVIGHKFKKRNLLQVYAVTGVFIALIIYLTFGDVLLARFEDGYTPIQKAFDLFYFIGDVLILYASIYLVYGIIQSKGQNPLGYFPISWILLTFGMAFMIVGDTTFSFFAWSEITVWQGFFNLYDLFYLLQYLFWILAMAAFPIAIMTTSEAGKIQDEPTVDIETLPTITEPESKSEIDNNTQTSNEVETADEAKVVDEVETSGEEDENADGEGDTTVT